MRRFGMQWDPPPDPIESDLVDRQVDHYHVQISRYRDFSVIFKEDRHVIATGRRFRVPPKTKFYGRVAAVDEEGNYSEWMYNTSTQLPPSSETQGVEADLLAEDDLPEKEIIGYAHIKADAIRVKHKIVGAKFMTSDDPDSSRIVIKDVEGENDRIKFYGKWGSWVGTLVASDGDVYCMGDFAADGLQFGRTYTGAPKRLGSARIYLQGGNIYAAVRETNNSTKNERLAWASETGTAAHGHTEYAQTGHSHDQMYYTKTEIDNLLNNYVKKGRGAHTHSISTANDGHGHGQVTGSSTVGS